MAIIIMDFISLIVVKLIQLLPLAGLEIVLLLVIYSQDMGPVIQMQELWQ